MLQWVETDQGKEVRKQMLPFITHFEVISGRGRCDSRKFSQELGLWDV